MTNAQPSRLRCRSKFIIRVSSGCSTFEICFRRFLFGSPRFQRWGQGFAGLASVRAGMVPSLKP